MQEKIYDVVIVGSGGAGLSAAIFAANKDMKVALISKAPSSDSHTISAQGGINASLGHIEKDDWRWHAYDTVKAACDLADTDSVEYMCQNAAKYIYLLDEMGADFDKTPEGKINQRVYGGQTTEFGQGKLAKRACFAKDKTGQHIINALNQYSQNSNIKTYQSIFVLDLIIDQEQQCRGVICWDMQRGTIYPIKSKSVIIASGGYSQIYSTTTCSSASTGDANGLVVRAGLPLQDMEFVQFHPTAISNTNSLLSEAARANGGILLNGQEQPFMERYSAKFRDLATRDVVSRAIATEIEEGRGAGVNKNHVWLDLRHLSSDFIRENLPTIHKNCYNLLSIDPANDLIPVEPAAHYTMGGIPTNFHCQVISDQMSTIAGLYAIGEAACISVHGAGRLGCNSLLDLIVFADLAVEHISSHKMKFVEQDDVNIDQYISAWSNIFTRPKQSNILELKQKLKGIMNEFVGIFRNHDKLQTAQELIEQLEKSYKTSRPANQSLKNNQELKDYLEVGNMIISAQATIKSALWRNESRGAHWRADFPARDDENYCYHSFFDSKEHIVRTRRVR